MAHSTTGYEGEPAPALSHSGPVVDGRLPPPVLPPPAPELYNNPDALRQAQTLQALLIAGLAGAAPRAAAPGVQPVPPVVVPHQPGSLVNVPPPLSQLAVATQSVRPPTHRGPKPLAMPIAPEWQNAHLNGRAEHAAVEDVKRTVGDLTKAAALKVMIVLYHTIRQLWFI